MTTVTIPKKEYQRFKQYSFAYIKIAEEIMKAEREFPYDYRYIDTLTSQALLNYKKGNSIEAKSVDEALLKFRTIGDHSIYRNRK